MIFAVFEFWRARGNSRQAAKLAEKGRRDRHPGDPDRRNRKMNRNELAEELSVEPWDIDDWLLWGCPAEKFLSQWNFNVHAVERWLKENKIKMKKAAQPLSRETGSHKSWLDKRCPKCREKGFAGEQAGLLCTYGEIVMGRWHFRRVGYPCGHSAEIFT